MIRFRVNPETSHSSDLGVGPLARWLRFRPPNISLDQLRDLVTSATSPSALIVVAIVELALILRLLRLQDLPGEMWGDNVVYLGLASQIIHGHPFLSYQYGGDGPMFFYLISLVSGVFGFTFFSIKLTAALLGTVVVAVTFFLARELFKRSDVAYVTAFLSAVSFWTLTQSRAGGTRILVPLFVALSILFAARRQRLLAGIFLGLGMYTQASFWGAAFVFLADIPSGIIGAVVAFPVLYGFVHNYSAYFGGGSYIGEKLGNGGHPNIVSLLGRIVANFWKNAESLVLPGHGDPTFRIYIVGHPTLDLLSSAFFLLGLALIAWKTIRERNTKLVYWFFLPLILIQIPSTLDVHPGNVPSTGRMLGIAPFVYMAVAYGVLEVAGWIRSQLARQHITIDKQLVSGAFIGIVLAAILAINFYDYFYVYPQGLPNGNTAFDQIIAQKVNSYPSNELVIIAGCCWGEWGQPEPGSIPYEVRSSTDLEQVSSASAAADAVKAAARPGTGRRAVSVIADPNMETDLSTQLRPYGLGSGYLLQKNGWNVAWVSSGYVKGQ
jgi:Dolichyl-phosphate-mannose-protein mannosyltransferase